MIDEILKGCPFCNSTMIKSITNRKFGLFKGYYAIVGLQCLGCNVKVRFEGSDMADDNWDLDTSIKLCERETIMRWNRRS